MSVYCECCVLSGRDLCTTIGRTTLDELIARPEESYRLWCVIVCDVFCVFFLDVLCVLLLVVLCVLLLVVLCLFL